MDQFWFDNSKSDLLFDVSLLHVVGPPPHVARQHAGDEHQHHLRPVIETLEGREDLDCSLDHLTAPLSCCVQAGARRRGR